MTPCRRGIQEVGFRIEVKSLRESSVRAPQLIEHLDVRLNAALVHQPAKHLGRAMAGVGDQARRLDVELLGAVEHRLGRPDLRLPNGGRRLDVDDHRMLQVDEIIIGIGVDGSVLAAAV